MPALRASRIDLSDCSRTHLVAMALVTVIGVLVVSATPHQRLNAG
jgi:hypothetical protein